MDEIFYTVELKCGFCGTKLGEHTLSSKFGWTAETAQTALPVVDMRCDPCTATHGCFKKMAEDYITKTGHDWPMAEAFVKANPKQKDFNTALSKIVVIKLEDNI